MNIVVKDAEGLPDKAYVSIRIGETRRQAPFKVGETFHFPSSQHATMKLDIFQSLGNQVVPVSRMRLDPKHTETVSVNGMKVTVACEAQEVVDPKRPSKHEAALKATKYLDEHAVQGTLQAMIHGLLAQQPADPLDFMVHYLKTQKSLVRNSCPGEIDASPVIAQEKNEGPAKAAAPKADEVKLAAAKAAAGENPYASQA
eukprot:gene227-284_t